jgi:hypothetical protein
METVTRQHRQSAAMSAPRRCKACRRVRRPRFRRVTVPAIRRVVNRHPSPTARFRLIAFLVERIFEVSCLPAGFDRVAPRPAFRAVRFSVKKRSSFGKDDAAGFLH